MKVVLDTNVLIGGFDDAYSASAKLIDAIRKGKLEAVRTSAMEREYRKMLRRLIKDEKYTKRVQEGIEKMDEVEGAAVEVGIDDSEDVKFIEAARGGGAEMIVTSDRHLLDIGEVGKIRMVTPGEAWRIYEEESGEGGWQKWVSGLGIK